MHVLLMKKLKYTEALLLLFSIQNWSFTSAMLTFNGKLYCAEGNSNFDWKASAKTSKELYLDFVHYLLKKSI